MSIRPYRDIHRRKSRQIMVGNVPVGGDAPITVQTMTNTLTSDAAATIDQIRRSRRPAPISCASPAPTRNRPPRCRRSCAAVERADRRRHPFPLQARASRRPRPAPPACASTRAISASPQRVREVVQAAKDHGCSMRIGVNAGILETRSAREIRRALPRGDGRERARPRAHPRGPRFPRVQDQREGVGRVPRRRRLSAAGRGLRLPAAPRHHRGRRPAQRHGQVVDRHRHRCSGPASATRSASRSRPIRTRRSRSASRS